MVFLLHKMVMITKKITRKNFPQNIFAFGCNMLMFVTTTSSLSSVTVVAQQSSHEERQSVEQKSQN